MCKLVLTSGLIFSLSTSRWMSGSRSSLVVLELDISLGLVVTCDLVLRACGGMDTGRWLRLFFSNRSVKCSHSTSWSGEMYSGRCCTSYNNLCSMPTSGDGVTSGHCIGMVWGSTRRDGSVTTHSLSSLHCLKATWSSPSTSLKEMVSKCYNLSSSKQTCCYNSHWKRKWCGWVCPCISSMWPEIQSFTLYTSWTSHTCGVGV